MRLFTEADPAPNPRRVRLFLAEKGVQIEEVRVPLRERAHKSPEHMARNPTGQVPTLELDDGTYLSETVSICRYLESLHPEPPMFGRGALEQAQVDQWIRRVELQLMTPVAMYWRHAHPLTAKLLTQFTDFGQSNVETVRRMMLWFDRQLEGRTYLASADFTMADICLLTTVDFASWIGLPTPDDASNLRAWRDRCVNRPGAGCLTA